MKIHSQLAAIATICLAAPIPALAQTSIFVTNPGFEADILSDGSVGSDPSGWFRFGSAGFWNPVNAAYPGGIEEGANVGFANDGGVIQTLSETLTAGDRYTLRVRIGNRADWPMGPYSVHLGALGDPIASASSPVPTSGEWEEVVIHYTAQAGDANLGEQLTIELSSPGIPGQAPQISFDDVRLVKNEPLEVPGDYPTIQSAIDAANPGATVRVASGTYPENLNMMGKAITLEGVGATRPTIDAGGAGSAIICSTGEGSDTVFRNLRIVGAANTGLRCIGASPTIELCEFSDNLGFNGGAISIDTDAPDTVVIENSLFVRNQATWDGGAISCGSDLIMRGCTLANNTSMNASPNGGALNVWASTIELESCVLWDNLPIELSGSGPGFQIIPSYSNIEGTWTGSGSGAGVGNLDVDPMFTLPVIGDYTLQPGSPMIDAGVAAGAFDLDLGPRAVDDVQICDTGPAAGPDADIGAYEFDGTSPHPSTTYCSTNTNSSGTPGEISAQGSLVVGDNSFVLGGTNLPPVVPGIFFYGANQIETPFGKATVVSVAHSSACLWSSQTRRAMLCN